MSRRKILKAELGVELVEDLDEKKYYMFLDGFSVFTNGIPKEYGKIIEKSYDNVVNIRKSEGKKNQ